MNDKQLGERSLNTVFDLVWDYLEAHHQVDGKGGAEYQRVLEAWLGFGLEVTLKRFIVAAANANSSAIPIDEMRRASMLRVSPLEGRRL